MAVNAVVVSDVHHAIGKLRKILPIINSSDYFVFCGDGIADVTAVTDEITTRICCVRGNCDYGSIVSERADFRLGGASVFVTHGHLYGVKSSLRDLAQIAKFDRFDIVLFGHSHKYTDIEIDGVRMINPGALCNGSYAIVTVDGNTVSCRQEIIQ